ncbi:MAG: alpha/beta hydrolase [Oxalicibacterium faecigallinarum]|nr:alpha/beta hydrolase [Oxalicibacterium faecigallinarum]
MNMTDMKPCRSQYLTLRGLRYHVRHWGPEGGPVVVMLHGWMDVSATFQFLVDAMQRQVHVIAPDWRGFGQTDWAQGGYWFADYLADLDALLAHYSPDAPVDLLGHSLGANVAGIYAGVRPARVKRLILLEGFGMPATASSQAPQRYAQWLDEVQEPPFLRTYATRQDVALRLQKNNRRLTDARAEFLSMHWSAQNAQGEWALQADPRHRYANPVLYRLDEVLSCWQAVQASVLWIDAADSELMPRFGNPEQADAEIARRKGHLAHVTSLRVQNAGHMLHHDQPEEIGRAVDTFLE